MSPAEALVLIAQLAEVEGCLSASGAQARRLPSELEEIGGLVFTACRKLIMGDETEIGPGDNINLANISALEEGHKADCYNRHDLATLAQWMARREDTPEAWRERDAEPPSLKLRERLDALAVGFGILDPNE